MASPALAQSVAQAPTAKINQAAQPAEGKLKQGAKGGGGASAKISTQIPANPSDKKQRGKVIARVNGEAVYQWSFDLALKKALAQGREDSPALRESVRNDVVARKLLLQAAQRQRIWDEPEVIEAHQSAMIAQYLLKNTKPETITDERVRARFEEMVSRTGPFQYHLRSIALRDKASADWALQQLLPDEQTGNQGADFAELARRVSRSGNAAQGGDMGWLSIPLLPTQGNSGALPLAAARSVLALEEGEITPEPVQVGNLFILLKLESKRPALALRFEDQEPTLRGQMQMEAAAKAGQELGAALAKRARIEFIKERGE